jgi:glycosyltransferase involved in cell wall biosynthesis
MKLIILVENLPVPLDRRVWQEAMALRDAGHQVTVVCPQMRGYHTPYEVLDGITIYRHWIADEARTVGGFIVEYGSALWGQFSCALKAWRRGGFDVVHYCNPPDLLFLVALPFRLLGGVKTVFDVHDLCPEMFQQKFPGHRLMAAAVRAAEWLSARLSDAVLATNESVRDAILQRTGSPAEKVFIVRTAPSIPEIDQVQPDSALRKDRAHLVGYVGVMGSTDGVEYLLRAAHHLVVERGRSDIQFHLMGAGPEYDNLLQLRDELGLAHCVEMPGRVSNAQLFTALRSMDVGVACDPIDGYNDHCTMNKTLEYMAFGKAQVIFGTKEGRYSAGESALAIMENSSERLAEGIAQLLDHPEQRETMGQAGLHRLNHELSWKESVKALLRAYGSL